MMNAVSTPERYRFEQFTIDLPTGELWNDGEVVALQPQPARVLALLARHAGQTVDREALRQHVWGDTCVDADQGLHNAIRLIRKALGDRADQPRYVVTVPRRGYRFVATLRPVPQVDPEPGSAAFPVTETSQAGHPAATRTGVSRWLALACALGAALLCLALLLPRAQQSPVSAPNRTGLNTTANTPAAAALAGTRRASLPTALPPATAPVVIAALPFKDLGPEPPVDRRESLLEEMITALAGIEASSARIIARTSAMRFAESTDGAQAIGEILGASHLVEGSICSEGGDLLVHARLLRAEDGQLVWGHKFRQAPPGLTALAREVATEVARSLNLPIPPQHDPGFSPEAHRAYREGRYHFGKLSVRSLPAAVQSFSASVAMEPDFAAAQAALGHALLRTWLSSSGGNSAGIDRKATIARARASVQRALALDAAHGEAHLAMAEIALLVDWQLDLAGQHFHRALQAEPGRAMYWNAYAFYLSALGRHEAAKEAAARALELDPVSPIVHGDVGLVYFHARDYDQAEAIFERMRRLEPDHPFADRALLDLALASNRLDTAVVIVRRIQEGRAPQASGRGASSDTALLAASSTRAAGDHRAILRTYFAAEYQRLSATDPPPVALLATVAARSGQEPRALAWLDELLQRRAPEALALRVDPRFDPLRTDPHFLALLGKLPPLPKPSA